MLRNYLSVMTLRLPLANFQLGTAMVLSHRTELGSILNPPSNFPKASAVGWTTKV